MKYKHCDPSGSFILPHIKIVSRDWITKVHHSTLLCLPDNVEPLWYTFSGFHEKFSPVVSDT